MLLPPLPMTEPTEVLGMWTSTVDVAPMLPVGLLPLRIIEYMFPVRQVKDFLQASAAEYPACMYSEYDPSFARGKMETGGKGTNVVRVPRFNTGINKIQMVSYLLLPVLISTWYMYI